MTRATLTAVPVVPTGIAAVATAIVSGDGAMFENDGQTYIWLENQSVASDATVTFTTPAAIAGLAIASQIVVVPHTAGVPWPVVFIGPFSTDLFNQPSGADVGKVYLDVDVAGLYAVAFRRGT